MLKTLELIDGVEEKYIPMLKKVNIVDFTKCISVFSGLPLQKIPNKIIKEYLLTWAKNKYRIFQMLGNELYKDIKFSYEKIEDDRGKDYRSLWKDYPEYGPWLRMFMDLPINKMMISYRYDTARIADYFPDLRIEGMSITHFCKKYLKFPDEVVTRIGRIYENNKVDANYTISIDPIDMMTASENPYDWCSCYRLETDNTESHADGCMAALLDKNSTITYVWTSEGKFKLYNYEIKNLRYKRMRQWVNISKNLTNISFNEIYPGKNYPDNFYKQLRELYEEVVASYKGATNYWVTAGGSCYRDYEEYGYSEFGKRVLRLRDCKDEDIPVYTEPIHCPCGCGNTLRGSDSDSEYLGNGFTCEGWEERYYCEYCDDYCETSCCGENCEGCTYWDNAHPVCELDTCEECDFFNGDHYVDDGVAHACERNCSDCPRWQEYKELNENEDEDDGTDLD